MNTEGPQIWWADSKLNTEFLQCGGLVLPTPALFRGQLQYTFFI